MKDISNNLHTKLRNLTNAHYLLILAYTVNIIVYDAWSLAAPEQLTKRWIAAGLLTLVITVIWYASRNKDLRQPYYKMLAYILIAADIAFAAYNVYLQRGIASKAIILFVIPIIVAVILSNISGITATAIISVAAYVVASAIYANEHPSEGYKVELYGELVYYSAVLLIIGSMLWLLRRKL